MRAQLRNHRQRRFLSQRAGLQNFLFAESSDTKFHFVLIMSSAWNFSEFLAVGGQSVDHEHSVSPSGHLLGHLVVI